MTFITRLLCVMWFALTLFIPSNTNEMHIIISPHFIDGEAEAQKG